MTAEASKIRVPSQDRAVRTRAVLVEAAEREFSAHGYAATTAKSIAARAKTATGSFYQYFTSKDQVLLEIAATRQTRVTDRALELLEGTPATAGDALARLRSVVELVIEYHADDPGLHAVLTERRHADRDLDELVSRGEQQLVERIAALLARWGHPGDRLATAFVLFGTLEGAVHAHVLGHRVVDDARFIDALVESLVRIALPNQAPASKGRRP
jgi:AcrR family transcriptional regulator